MKSAIDLLGPRFTGAVIEDEAIEPYFITCVSGSCYTVSRKREDKHGELKYTDVCYPGSLEGCLRRIAKEKMNGEDGVKLYGSLREYVDRWQETIGTLVAAIEETGMKEI